MTEMPFNSLLRVSILQILRSIGFDKAPPQAIDVLTDLYIRHLQLLTSETLLLSNARGSDEIEIQDITQALINLGMLKPSDLLDVYEQHENYECNLNDSKNQRIPNIGGIKGAKQFLLWVVGNVPDRARTVSKPTIDMINGVHNLNGQIKNQPVIPEYINALNNVENEIVHEPEQEVNIEEDWLKYLMKKSSKLGTVEGKFKNTLLMDGTLNSDYLVSGPTVDESIESKLPYNQRDDYYENEI